MQTKWQSFIEAKTNTLSSFFISWFLMHFIIPLIWEQSYSPSESFSIVLLFTTVSVMRNYFIRRLFNKIHHTKPKPRANQYNGKFGNGYQPLKTKPTPPPSRMICGCGNTDYKRCFICTLIFRSSDKKK